ncbi:MAG: hypothetical protein RIC80_05375 [Cyclobacteriaceae bacterium]
MVDAFVKFLGGHKGEEKAIMLLLGMGFFMGIYTASYEVGAKALFISTMGEGSLSLAFFTAGVVGILSTVLFTNVQKRINFSTLSLTNVFLTFLFMGVLRYAFSLDPAVVPYYEFLPFVLFVMIGPIAAIQYLTFWGLFGRIFNLRQSKRIVGGIDTGQLTATILAFFSIPLLVNYVIDETYDLLFVAAIASFGIFVFTFWIIRSFNVDAVTKKATLSTDEVDAKEEDIKYSDLWKNQYFKWMSLFLFVSMGASVFVDYTFYTAAEVMYPDEKELASFLSFFEALTMIFVFIFQSFFNDKIIEDYGLKFSLRVMPLILLFFIVGVIFSGHVYGYEIKTDEYLFFFIFNVMAKLFTSSIKDSLENPAFKLFFLPLPVKIRFSAQNMIEGVVNEFAVLAAGAVQIGLGLLTFFELIHYSYFIVGLAVLVIVFAGKVFDEYKKSLKSTLEFQKDQLKQQGVANKNENNTINALVRELKERDPLRIINAMKLMERMDPIQLEFTLLDQIKSPFPEVRKYSYERLESRLVFNALSIVERVAKTETHDTVVPTAKKCLEKLTEANSFELTFNNIRPLVRSLKAEERIYAARLLSSTSDEKIIPFLKELLRDINPSVRLAAMISAGKTRMPELWSILVENLHLPKYSNAASSALTANGDSVFHTIDTAFYKTGQHFDTMLRVIQILGRVGGKNATELLWKKIDFPDRKIITELLLSLSYIGFEAKDSQAARIKIAIESDIGDIAWNLKVLSELEREDDIERLIYDGIKEENTQNYSDIFMLLAMVYDSQSIMLVKENIDLGTTESITFGVEMLDLFIDEDLKHKIVPILDDLEDDQRIVKLNNHFPPENFESYRDLLLQIVNRDYNHINRWSKALALWKVGDMEGEVDFDLIANLFNPDPFLLQTAAAVIYRLDKSAYHHHTGRLKPGVKKDLDRAILPPIYTGDDDDYHQKMLAIEKAIFLKSLHEFREIPGTVITDFAQSFDEVKVPKGYELFNEDSDGSSPMYIVVSGSATIVGGEFDGINLPEKSIIGDKLVAEDDKCDFKVVTNEESVLLLIYKDELFTLMSKHIELVQEMISVINKSQERASEVSEELIESVFV